jgi:hypothetical protein
MLAPARDGESITFLTHDYEQIEDVARIFKVRLDGSEEDVITRTRMGHHAHVELEGNRYGWLAQESAIKDVEGDLIDLWADQIFEAPEGSLEDDEPEEAFSFYADYPHEPWDVCEHMGQGSPWGQAWTHANSLAYRDGHYYIGPRWLDSIIKIDAATGEVVWEMGGLHTDFTGTSGVGWFSHAHWSHIWEDGAVIFDNAVETSEIASIMEIRWDEEARTVEKVFEFQDPDGRFMMFGGDARKLEGGNYLASFVQLGDLMEVNPQGEVVWRAQTQLGAGVGRVTFIEDIYSLPSP